MLQNNPNHPAEVLRNRSSASPSRQVETDRDSTADASAGIVRQKPRVATRMLGFLSAVIAGIFASDAATADSAGQAAPGCSKETPLHPVIDRSVYDELAEGIGEETARQMLDGFLEDTRAQLALLGRLSCRNDRPQIKREAHSLKSGAATFGLMRLSALAQTLQIKSPRMNEAEFRAELHLMEQAFDEAVTQLPVQLAAAQ